MTVPVRSLDVRSSIVTTFRRDLVGPGPQDADIASERLSDNPSRWYLTGFLAPAQDPLAQDGPQASENDPSVQEESIHPVGAAGMALSEATAPPCQAARATGIARRQFHGSSAARSVILWSAIRANTSASQAWGSMSLSLAV